MDNSSTIIRYLTGEVPGHVYAVRKESPQTKPQVVRHFIVIDGEESEVCLTLDAGTTLDDSSSGTTLLSLTADQVRASVTF